ncbi:MULTISPECIES: 50S ribosomal protein L29 [Polycladomyces]|jgi:large subunit ribosomal protein L29|uniref:Large ribosomal subunit protein uL29 n=3 Tax=Polycladomyces TaxID=1348505 RepID=A0A8D5ZJC3_9BACL|nr:MULTISPECIES: 50S ribosomal protein L29 [Polycladomyces]MBN2909279.1 50S ribosomal protein L29 [Polycladomyces sp. WAk]MDN4593599.1 50S ribosomal protein L29 [Polycladomyces subterraneus]BCU80399.1 50S ribosomal protein L29 [Polycladomyces abyssicola]
MKAKELMDMTTAEIEQKLRELKEELFNLRFQKATGQLENPARIRQVRKDIARAKTVLRERELGIERRKQA